LNQNTNNLIVVDFDSTQLDINYLKYAIQNQEKTIMKYFHGTCQQFINASDLNRLFSGGLITFRRPKKDEDLTGKLLFNRVGKFGVDIHE
jgi:hypothetical protein